MTNAAAPSYFAGARNAPVFERGIYMEPNNKFLLKLTRTFVKATREKGDAFIAEFEIVESTSPTQKVGSKVNWYQGLVKKDIAFGSIKELFYALLGKSLQNNAEEIRRDIDPEIEELMQEAVTSNSLADTLVRCQTSVRVTKDKKDFTQHTWSPAAA